MYIKTGGIKYPCTGRLETRETVRFTAAGLPEAVTGAVELCRDDGFVLAAYDAGDWLRVVIDAAGLTLTDLPEPGPEPEPPEPVETITMEDVAEMMLDHEVRIAAQEMGMTGGNTDGV